MTFARILTVPVRILKDFIRIMKLDLVSFFCSNILVVFMLLWRSFSVSRPNFEMVSAFLSYYSPIWWRRQSWHVSLSDNEEQNSYLCKLIASRGNGSNTRCVSFIRYNCPATHLQIRLSTSLWRSLFQLFSTWAWIVCKLAESAYRTIPQLV